MYFRTRLTDQEFKSFGTVYAGKKASCEYKTTFDQLSCATMRFCFEIARKIAFSSQGWSYLARPNTFNEKFVKKLCLMKKSCSCFEPSWTVSDYSKLPEAWTGSLSRNSWGRQVYIWISLIIIAINSLANNDGDKERLLHRLWRSLRITGGKLSAILINVDA